MKRRISIFGATGSIGTNTIDLIARQGGADAFDVRVLTGGRNIETLAEQARALGASVVVTAYPDRLEPLRAALAGTEIAAYAGPEALNDAAREPVDWAMSAIVGAAGLAPTLEMARHAGTLALANKESLVCAGPLLRAVCAAHTTRLLPVDSEHSAIFQALGSAPKSEIERIIITASGGPFRTWSREQIAKASLDEALNHPNWSMGQRITIDSASMFNKALEVIEARALFDVEPQQIEVVIHPQSIVHSMVGFTDGAVMAQLGPPDMRGAIGFALNYPERLDLPVARLDFGAMARLDFETPDLEKFPGLGLAWEAMDIGGGAGAVLNAAKEIALDHFLAQRIGFAEMAGIVAEVLHELADDAAAINPGDGIAQIHLLDARARGMADAVIAARSGRSEKKAI